MPAVAHPVRDHCLASGSFCDGSDATGDDGTAAAEVLLDADAESYRVPDPGCQLTLPAAGERFTVLDLLIGIP